MKVTKISLIITALIILLSVVISEPINVEPNVMAERTTILNPLRD